MNARRRFLIFAVLCAAYAALVAIDASLIAKVPVCFGLGWFAMACYADAAAIDRVRAIFDKDPR